MMRDCFTATAISNLRGLRHDTRVRMNRMQPLPLWTPVETKDMLCFNAALTSCEITPIFSSAHLAFIKLCIAFQSHCSLWGWFSLITVHLGLTKDEFCRSPLTYLRENRQGYHVRYLLQASCFVFLEVARCNVSSLPLPPWWKMILALFTGALWIRYESQEKLCFKGQHMHVCWTTSPQKSFQRKR